MSTKSNNKNDTAEEQVSEAAVKIPVQTVAAEPPVTVILTENTLVGRHWHPKGCRLALPKETATTLASLGKARILGI